MSQSATFSTLQRLGYNFVSLVLLQGINYLVPLITIPYLVRVMGIDQFGLLSFVMAVTLYGVMVTDYGFDLSATKLVSMHRDEPEKLNEIFSAVLTIKAILAVAYMVVIAFLTLTVEKFSCVSNLFFIAYLIVIGQVLFPVWFFQGIEEMRYITIMNAFSKLFFIVMILLFVKGKEDIDLVLWFNGIGTMVAGLWAFFLAKRRYGVFFSKLSYKTLRHYLADGWYIFTSRIAVELYSSANIIILGFFAPNAVVGYYAIVEKIIHAMGNVLEPVTRAVYPYLAKLYRNSKERFFKRNMQLSLLIFLSMLPVTLGTIYFAQEILRIIIGHPPEPEVVKMLQLASVVLIGYLYGSQFTNMLVTLGETKMLNAIVMIAGALNLLLAPLVLYLGGGAMGLIWILIFIDFFIVITKGYFVYVKFRPQYVGSDHRSESSGLRHSGSNG